MKPTVIAASQPGAGGGGGNGNGTPAGPGINIPISREYVGSGASPQQQQHPQHYAQQQQPAQFYASQPAAYGSPRQQQQPQVPINPQQQHFQVSDWLKINGASLKVASLLAYMYICM